MLPSLSLSFVISPTHVQVLKGPLSVRLTSLTVTVTLDIGVSQTTMSVMEQTTAQMEEMKIPVYVMRISRMHDS